jgi:hypothetical protein
MKTNILKIKSVFAICAMALTVFVSCEENNDTPEPPAPEVKKDFQLAFASGSGSISGTYLQGVSDLSTGEITFSGKGYSMTSSRTARVFVSEDGSTIYSLNYTEGTIDKLTYQGGDDYTKIITLDASIPLGNKTIRFTKLDDKEASVHYIAATAVYENETEYKRHKMTASIGILDLETMQLKSGFNKDIDVVINAELAAQGYYISRIDAPVISGNKLYYGAAVSKFNASTGKNDASDRAFTLVLDYPSLANATAIETTKVKGSTNGYRTPTLHKNEAGDILQMVSGNDETHIVKIRDGQYDSSFDYNLSALLGKGTSSNGWFYAGNGIGYIPYEDLSKEKIQTGVNPQGEPSYSAAWGLARMDLNNNTVVDLKVPENLWLTQYQTSVIRDGIFYIALSPIGGTGNIYMFDISSTSPNGTLGAKITSGADQYYVGIY